MDGCSVDRAGASQVSEHLVHRTIANDAGYSARDDLCVSLPARSRLPLRVAASDRHPIFDGHASACFQGTLPALDQLPNSTRTASRSDQIMSVPVRLNQYIATEKQRLFPRDFLAGWTHYETWEQARVGEISLAQRTFQITEEDILAYNLACGETDPLMIDPSYARKHSPTGELLQHPIFVTTIGFYTVGEKGIGTWMRTPGARNPGQRIEIFEPFRYGEIITTTVTTHDKYVQRGKPYIQMLLDFRNPLGVHKARWRCALILPATRSDVARFADA
jgi:acyl dehydratase